MRDWFDYSSPSGLDRIFDCAWDDGQDDDLIMLYFSKCEDDYLDTEED